MKPMKDKILTFGIDFDGTVVAYDYPRIGQDIGSQRVLKRILDKGHKLILNTMRSGQQLQEAVNWFQENDIELFGIQFHPTQHTWTTSNKCYANHFIDDAAIGTPLKEDETISKKPFVDWDAMEQMLIAYGLLD
jgi:hypothetical protein